MNKYPKVISVQPLQGKRLLVTFSNNIKKVYDCTPLLAHETYIELANEAIFQNVKADQGGYGISWTDEIDLAESELWINGLLADQTTQTKPQNVGKSSGINSAG
jgi:hypothetical protein